MNEFQRKLFDTVGANSFAVTFAERGRQVAAVEPYSYVINLSNYRPAWNQVYSTTDGSAGYFCPMDSDSDFVFMSITGAATTAFPDGFGSNIIPIFNPSWLMQIRDLSDGTAFFAGYLPMALVCAQAGYPYFLPRPRVIKARSTIQLQTRHQSAIYEDTFLNPYFVMHGAKIYYA